MEIGEIKINCCHKMKIIKLFDIVVALLLYF